MRNNNKQLPSEYTDLFLLLARLPFKYHDVVVEIKTYAENDLIIKHDKGELCTFCDGSPLKLLGTRLSIFKGNVSGEGVWDVRVTCEASDDRRIKNDNFLRSIENVCEQFGYTFLGFDNGQFYLEIMDRVILNGYSIDGAKELCMDFGINYDELCVQALKRKCSTYQLLADKVSRYDMDKLYYPDENQKAESFDAAKSSKTRSVVKDSAKAKGVNIFNDSKSTKY